MRRFGNDFKIIVNQNYSNMTVEVYGQVMQGDRMFIIGYDGEYLVEQELTQENEFKPIKEYKPLFRISRFQFDDLIKAFVALANDKNIQTENENLLQGKLTATETHLTDMREMTKKLLDAVITKV